MTQELKGHTGIVDGFAISPDGKTLASCSSDKSVKLWNLADGKELKTLGSHANSVYSVAFSPDGKTLASASADMTIKIWDIASQKETKSLKGPTAAITGIAFTDNNSLVSIGQDRFVRIWNAQAGTETKKMGPTPDDLYGLALSKDIKSLATSGYGGNVAIWNLADGKASFNKKLKLFGAYCVAFSPDEKFLITGHDSSFLLITPIK
jgi:WD40 repeat protein